MRVRAAAGAAVVAACALVAGCGSSETAAGDPTLTGVIRIDGSSTVGPLSEAAGAAFRARHPGVQVNVAISGTGAGFEAFCAGTTDIQDASRRISPKELRACATAGVAWIELEVARDGITIVTNRSATVGTACLTVEELRTAWRKGSPAASWRDLGPRFSDLPLALAGPGDDSGTFDFFNEKVLGVGSDGKPLEPRSDYASSEDDDVTVSRVESAPAGMGYFGYSYFAENATRLKAFAIDDGGLEGCVTPSPTTIVSGQYPLSRPLFLYVSRASLRRPEVSAFVTSYLQDAGALARSAGIVPAGRLVLDHGLQTLATT